MPSLPQRGPVELDAPKGSDGLSVAPAPRPKLVNRGPAGLLTKVPKKGPEEVPKEVPKNQPLQGPPLWEKSKKNNIVPALKLLRVKMDTLHMDPLNARLHPVRNMESIKDSLCLYGQVKPVVVRQATGVITAGNGTYEAAKELGWTEIAATMVEFDEVQAAGYGLADNRTAELAKWDFEVVARIDKLLLDAGHASVGWSLDELEVLRVADWVPPAIIEGGAEGAEPKSLLVSFTPDQYVTVDTAIKLIQAENSDLDEAECLVAICQHLIGG